MTTLSQDGSTNNVSTRLSRFRKTLVKNVLGTEFRLFMIMMTSVWKLKSVFVAGQTAQNRASRELVTLVRVMFRLQARTQTPPMPTFMILVLTGPRDMVWTRPLAAEHPRKVNSVTVIMTRTRKSIRCGSVTAIGLSGTQAREQGATTPQQAELKTIRVLPASSRFRLMARNSRPAKSPAPSEGATRADRTSVFRLNTSIVMTGRVIQGLILKQAHRIQATHTFITNTLLR